MPLNALFATIEERTGTQLKDTRLERAQRLLLQLETQLGVEKLLDTLARSDLNAPLWQKIIQEITVGETYFFRNQPQFNALRDVILPPIIAQRRAQNQRYLRLWSAGCATGEEPYSLAMLLRDLLPDWREWSLFILATDLNQAMLETAHSGQYRAASFRGETPPTLQARWFQQKEGLYHIDPSLRQMVHFRPLNLIEGQYPSLETYTVNHDVVLCRNVTIYFDNKQTHEVIQRLYGALRDGGWLIVGHAEPQLHIYDSFRMVQESGTILYQKVAAHVPPPVKAKASEAKPSTLPIHSLQPATPQPTAPLAATPLPDSQLILADARRAADLEDWQTAVDLLKQIEQSDRYNPLFHFVRALVMVQTDRDAALEALAQSVYCDPKFVLGYYWQGELWAQYGAMQRAVTYWRRADKALDTIPADSPIPGENELTAAALRELIAYRLGNV
jgi:chemotaxis protein methyltransferase CheR